MPEPGEQRPLDRVRAALAEVTANTLGAAGSVQGAENLPTTGAAIVAFNHVSVVDGLLTNLVAERRITFPGTEGSRVRGLLTRLGAKPEDELDPARRVLARGDLLGIFPEGGRSPDGRLYRGHTQVARLALETGVPVVPAGVVVQPGRRLGQGIVFGEPLDLSRFATISDRELALRTATDTVMAAIAAASGQVYVDRDASEQREELHREKREQGQAARAQAAQERAEREAAQRRAQEQAARDAAELADAHAAAERAAREHAERAAAADRARREAVRSVRHPSPSGEPVDRSKPPLHRPDQQ